MAIEYYSACICVCVMGVSGSHLNLSQTLANLLMSSLQATGRVLLKVHAIALATGKNTSLLGMLDQSEVEMVTYLWWPIIHKRATTSSRDWLW